MTSRIRDHNKFNAKFSVCLDKKRFYLSGKSVLEKMTVCVIMFCKGKGPGKEVDVLQYDF